jgi:hypothetical protein
MIAGMLLLNQVLQEGKPHKETKEKNNNHIIDNAYFTEIRDIKGNLKGVKYVKSRSRRKISGTSCQSY